MTPSGLSLDIPADMAEKLHLTKDGREDMRYASSKELWAWALSQEARILAQEEAA
jgi:hypothetical protein